MVAGAFKSMKHDHEFLEHPTGTQMKDRFEFQSPIGILGKIVDQLFLRAYLERFLVHRNVILRKLAESKEWSHYLAQV